jgi:hypothetical protein
MDTTAKSGGVAVGDGQVRDGDGFTRSDVKYGTLGIAINSEEDANHAEASTWHIRTG